MDKPLAITNGEAIQDAYLGIRRIDNRAYASRSDIKAAVNRARAAVADAADLIWAHEMEVRNRG